MVAYVVMGVSGCGKSTIGKLLSEKLSLPFLEGDEFHPQTNLDKMASGKPLDNDDRLGWIDALAKGVNAESSSCVLSCSALNSTVRSWIDEKIDDDVCYICLSGERSVILARLQDRNGHFFPPALLDSQLASFDAPGNALNVDIDQSVDKICAEICIKISSEKVI